MNDSVSTETRNSTRRAFYASALSLLLCVAMLAGVTFAWFSDTTKNEGNTIASGTINVKAYGYDANPDPTALWYDPVQNQDLPLKIGVGADTSVKYDFDDGKVISEVNFEPNKSGAKYIIIENTGTLPADVHFKILNADKPLVPGGPILADVIKYKVVPIDASAPIGTTGTKPANWSNDPDVKVISTHPQMYDNTTGVTVYPPQDTDASHAKTAIVRIDYYMSSTANSDYQGKTANISIAAVADQHNTYGYPNMGSTYHQYKLIYNNADLTSAISANNPGWTLIFMNNIAYSGDLTFTNPANIDLNGHTLLVDGVLKFNYDSTSACALGISNGLITADKLDFSTLTDVVVNLDDTLKIRLVGGKNSLIKPTPPSNLRWNEANVLEISDILIADPLSWTANTLQVALNDSLGSAIYLPAGLYDVTPVGELQINKANSVLIGETGTIVTGKVDNVNIIDVIRVAAKNVIIDGLMMKFRNDSLDPNILIYTTDISENLLVKNCTFDYESYFETKIQAGTAHRTYTIEDTDIGLWIEVHGPYEVINNRFLSANLMVTNGAGKATTPDKTIIKDNYLYTGSIMLTNAVGTWFIDDVIPYPTVQGNEFGHYLFTVPRMEGSSGVKYGGISIRARDGQTATYPSNDYLQALIDGNTGVNSTFTVQSFLHSSGVMRRCWIM